MKKVLFIILFILMLSNFAFSQNKLPELEKLRKIKIFKSTQQDVKKILAEYIDEEYDVKYYFQHVPTKNGEILITFANGNCADDSYWNVSKGLATSVAISHIEGLKVKGLDFNLNKFKREIEDKEYPEEINYHDEEKGVFIETDEGNVSKITFYPPKSKKAFLCTNENTADIISGEERLVDVVSPFICILKDMPPVINEITLGKTEAFANGKNEKIEITVKVNATDPEGAVLTYNYLVSAGKIIGQGASVVWDLTNVKSGTYTIITTIDDGCGDCAKPMSKTVFVK